MISCSRNGNKREHGCLGVFLPNEYGKNAAESRARQAEHTMGSGFLLMKVFSKRVYVVQSLKDKRLYLVKRFEHSDNPVFPWQYSGDQPPEFRISTGTRHQCEVTLSGSCFNSLETHYTYENVPNERVYELYFEYLNGGSLESLRDRYYEREARIPESFIWHVARTLCEAIRRLRTTPTHVPGIPSLTAPAQRPVVYHRNISMKNIMLDYRNSTYGGNPFVEHKYNVLPRVILCDFGQAAVQGDDETKLPKFNLFPEEQRLNYWEDSYAIGCVLRSLCMTHIPFPQDSRQPPIPGQTKDETERWQHRPDSRRLDDVNAYPVGTPYSDDLMNMLKNFEWDDQENRNIADQGCRNACAPDLNFIINTLEPRAVAAVDALQFEHTPLGRYYDPRDVSWTRPWAPMPFICNLFNMDRSHRRIYKSTRREDYRICGLDYSLPDWDRIDQEFLGPSTQPPPRDGY
ncbi:uncharacterized protein GGS22DRAFT_112125 [Annulohypoxylon maeteangense]|uniref:uncharacterized protein n=1 Tax=Annulohypoxylon maeteangense TaxID=1927788 RepID=UPI002007D3F6|nr:uncharacterized protein GGS22DRAFT_112125 [Annulohypoxylon maeteangense]KAI0887630.1 hypothetical protein GGS22DRAFT_112125 [Annulohypoxylon maeteangense]